MNKFKKGMLAFLASISLLFAFSFVKPVKADSWNQQAETYKYVGTTFLYKWLATQNIRYHSFDEVHPIHYRHGKPEGVVIHETADPGATAKDEALYFNSKWNKIYAYVHAFVDHQTVMQMMTPNLGCWGAGPMANDRFVQIELCEETTRPNFAKSINNDAIYAASILHRYHLKPTNATHNGKGTVWSHYAVSKFLGGTDHTDPTGYFAKWGYSMDDFFQLIKHYYDLQGANTSQAPKKSKRKTNKKSRKPAKKKARKKAKKKTNKKNKKKTTKKAKARAPKQNLVKQPSRIKKGWNLLMHDSRIYNAQGKPVSKKIHRAGTGIYIKGTKFIKHKKYYQIGKKQYVAAANVEGTARTLKHNAYLYDTIGMRDGKSTLKKGTRIRTFGAAIKLNSVKFYALNASVFVKVGNF